MVLLNNWENSFTAWPTVTFAVASVASLVREVDPGTGAEVPVLDDSRRTPALTVVGQGLAVHAAPTPRVLAVQLLSRAARQLRHRAGGGLKLRAAPPPRAHAGVLGNAAPRRTTTPLAGATLDNG